jgi:hypothetical protein
MFVIPSKRVTLTGALVLSLGAAVFAEGVPRKQPVGRYAKLWTQSPLTEKPPPPPPKEQVSELDDYTLAGVSPLDGGYSVVLINKKERDNRIHLLPGMTDPPNGFKVISVIQDPFEKSNTSVEIQTASGKKGRVGYEEKYLALKAAAVSKQPAQKNDPKANNNSKIPGVNAPKTQPPNPRAPRVRRVPTPSSPTK